MNCPFCSSNDLQVRGREFTGSFRAWVLCLRCRAKGPLAASRSEAIKHWNQGTSLLVRLRDLLTGMGSLCAPTRLLSAYKNCLAELDEI